MEVEWDEHKRLSNIAKHGIDFLDAASIFFAPHLSGAAREVDGEERCLAVGMMDGRLIAVIFTWRSEDRIRIISARRARDVERRHYQAVFAH